jgi:uncharacterized protein (DUF1684 family)
MKTTILIFSLLIATVLNAQDKKKNTEASKFQTKLNKDFSSNEDSPLTEEDLETFTKLDFFAIDSAFIVTAKLEFHKDSKPFKMATTTDRLPVYKLYATASFTLQGKAFQLEIYQNEKLTLSPEYEDHLFLPFTDNTNGETSYGGGRYIDLNVPEGDQIIIDFNQAYNPYCAYNHKYSCPIPPEVNHLDTEVKAGVMAYKKH